MKKRIGALALSICLMLTAFCPALAAQLGPASTYDDLLALAGSAAYGDTLLVSGTLIAVPTHPLTTNNLIFIRGTDGASILNLALDNASVIFSDLMLIDGLTITGESHVQFERGVSVLGSAGCSAISFTGSGALLLDPGSEAFGGEGAPGVHIAHTGGDLYISLDGKAVGGAGETGGAAAVIDPLGNSGAVMITGQLIGGAGSEFGGNALNLHNLHGNALITVDGQLTGGAGSIGGSGLQLITAEGSVNAGLGGRIVGGKGESYGGDAVMLMNVSGAASIALSGSLIGGDASGRNATPGQSLKLLGKTTAMHTIVGDCNLQDGRQIYSSISVTPLPTIPSEDAEATPTPETTPLPSLEPTIKPSETPSVKPTVKPSVAPSVEPTIKPSSTPTIEPTVEPTVEPTIEPSATPTVEPTVEPSATPTVEPTVELTVEPSATPTVEPTIEPSTSPTIEPTVEPTVAPSDAPTE